MSVHCTNLLTRKNNGLACQRAESTYILARGFSLFFLKTSNEAFFVNLQTRFQSNEQQKEQQKEQNLHFNIIFLKKNGQKWLLYFKNLYLCVVK
jgi:hypothetical protein